MLSALASAAALSAPASTVPGVASSAASVKATITSVKAREILDSRGVMVVPDILANAGGVTVSYFEWVQDRMGYFWTEEIVNSRLEQVMVRAFHSVADMAEKHNVNLRTGAYLVAIDRVARVYRMRGVFA